MPTPQITDERVETKFCRRCGRDKPLDEFYDDTRKDNKRARDGKKPYCKPCWLAESGAYGKAHPEQRAEAQRRWRQRNPDRPNNTEQDYEKRKAWWTLNEAIRSGTVVKPGSCEGCGRPYGRLHGHHEDYSKPLDVDWWCASCHKNHHLAIDRGER